MGWVNGAAVVVRLNGVVSVGGRPVELPPGGQSALTCCVWAYRKMGTIIRNEAAHAVVDTTCSRKFNLGSQLAGNLHIVVVILEFRQKFQNSKKNKKIKKFKKFEKNKKILKIQKKYKKSENSKNPKIQKISKIQKNSKIQKKP